MHLIRWTDSAGKQHKTWGPDGLLPIPVQGPNAKIIGLVISGRSAYLIGTEKVTQLTQNGPVQFEGWSVSWLCLPDETQSTKGLGTTEPIVSTLPQTVPYLVRKSGKRVALNRVLTVVGRKRWCDLTLRDSAVSNVHCCLLQTTNQVYLYDLNSTNGVFVAGQRVTSAALRPGLALRIGCTPFVAGDRGLANPSSSHANLPSKQMLQIDNLIYKIGPSTAPIVITGESGVGKDGIARLLHQRSGREGAYIAINAATLRLELSGSELFGHKKGSFTGAVEDYDGAFIGANGGTLFLDEIGELSFDIQAELLRVLETKEVRSLGSTRAVYSDVRIIAATHRNLIQAIGNGTFREDLFHRIYVLPLHIPPLRTRLEDLDAIVYHFLNNQTPPRRISTTGLAHLRSYRWSGNIRELLNVLRRACVLSRSTTLETADLTITPTVSPEGGLDSIIHKQVLEAYSTNGKSVAQTAKQLGIHRATIYRHLKRDRQDK